MYIHELTDAATTASNIHELDDLSRLTWRGLAEGHLSEADAEAASSAIEARRATLRTRSTTRRPRVLRPIPKPTPRSPDREATLRRRRSLAASGVVPGRLAGPFTTSELAVLAVIGRECQKGGSCRLPMDAIAALAGVCRSTVRSTLRHARSIGLVVVRERRRANCRSLPNVVTVCEPDWSRWLKRRRGQNLGGHVVASELEGSKIEPKVSTGVPKQPPQAVDWLATAGRPQGLEAVHGAATGA